MFTAVTPAESKGSNGELGLPVGEQPEGSK
jgi:hypothetical protein